MTIPLSGRFVHRVTVAEEHIDEMQHVNNLVYLKWTLKAAVAHSSHVGWTGERYKELGSGFVVRSHQIKYKQSAVLGDEIMVTTWIADMEKVTSLRRYEIRRASDNALLADASTNWVFVDLKTQRLAKIPPQIVAAFRADAKAS